MSAATPVAPSPHHVDLMRFYLDRGLAPGQFWFGREHPALEEAALRLLATRSRVRVLEIGYQAGGFAVPVITSLHRTPGFHYTGLDSLAYPNAVTSELLTEYLTLQGVAPDRFRLLKVDAWDFLMTCPETFDLILIDHVKSLYPRELETVLSRRRVAAGGLVLLHDVLEKATEAWVECARICATFGCRWHVDGEVPAGLAIVEAGEATRSFPTTMVGLKLGLRFAARRLARAGR